jgi:hypothetical protein
MKIDLFDPEIQQILTEFELNAYPDGSGLAFDPEIQKEFLSGFRQPYICALIADVLSGRWKLGTTMTEVADRIGTDHPTISRALRWGELPWTVESFLLACPTKPHDLDVVIGRVFHARHRAAVMNVAEYLAAKRPEVSWPRLGCLREVHMELIAALFENRQAWKMALLTRDVTIVHRIISEVIDDASHEIIPFWYEKRRRLQLDQLINRFRSNDSFTIKYLSFLQTRWERIFVAAHFASEGLGWVLNE